MPSARVRRMTAGLVSGETTKLPPASCDRVDILDREHRAGSRSAARPAKALAAAAIDFSASGELSGTSIMVMPASTSALADSDGFGRGDAAQDGDDVAVLVMSSCV